MRLIDKAFLHWIHMDVFKNFASIALDNLYMKPGLPKLWNAGIKGQTGLE